MDAIGDDYLNFLGLASHEYFHAWNVKRIKPAAFAPYDLARENYTRQLWAFEGITSYYDDLALARCGLIGPERYLELLARTITTVLRTPGRRLQSVAESSFDAWIKYYRQDENTPNAVVSYYTKGALVALRARPDAAPRRAHVARPRDARAVGTLRHARHRRARGRHSRARERTRGPRPLRLLRALRRRHRGSAAARAARGVRRLVSPAPRGGRARPRRQAGQRHAAAVHARPARRRGHEGRRRVARRAGRACRTFRGRHARRDRRAQGDAGAASRRRSRAPRPATPWSSTRFAATS